MKSILAVILQPVLIMEYIYTKSQTLPAGRRELKVKNQKQDIQTLLPTEKVMYEVFEQASFEQNLCEFLEKTEELHNICFGQQQGTFHLTYTSKTKRQHRLSV